jgi:hypothetical protein
MITISTWINRAGFEPWGGGGFALCVPEFKGREYSTIFNRCRTQAAAQIRRGYTRSEWHFPARAEIFALPYY